MLPREVIQRVREIQVRTGREVADVLAGQYSSVFKGRGIEFDEVRPYVPGDEVRSIDWNVTARMGEPFVKRYVEERQLTLMLLADVSDSQEFGSAKRSKREAAAELCALLAFSATYSDDKVGLALFHDDIEHYIPARKGQKHALRVVREVLTHAPDEADSTGATRRPRRLLSSREGRRFSSWLTARRRRFAGLKSKGTNIGGAVEFLLKVAKRRTVTFVVSDFFDDDYISKMQMAARKHDVIAVLVTDPRELEMPSVGIVDLEDAETGQRIQIDTSSSAFRNAVVSGGQQRIAELSAKFRSAKIDFIHVDASSSIVDPVAKFFRMRERRRQR
ncbi:MAG TPA: DUF58 domain-containing protein [Planctomycetaceae bacterium]|nr:DUF58 domain-containing protein [Planctomycetaceae bacterium]